MKNYYFLSYSQTETTASANLPTESEIFLISNTKAEVLSSNLAVISLSEAVRVDIHLNTATACVRTNNTTVTAIPTHWIPLIPSPNPDHAPSPGTTPTPRNTPNTPGTVPGSPAPSPRAGTPAAMPTEKPKL